MLAWTAPGSAVELMASGTAACLFGVRAPGCGVHGTSSAVSWDSTISR